MLEIKEKEIDGLVFRFNPLMATEARRTLVGLINRFGGSLASGVEGLGDVDFEKSDGDKDISSLLGRMTSSAAGIITQISANLTPDYYEKLCDVFGKRSELKMSAEGGQERWMTLDKGIRDMQFGNKLLTEAKWIGFCLEVQYADFFELVTTASHKAVALRAIATMPSTLSSPEVSTGTSSE